ncbi:peptidylprolyl isomerase [Pontiella sulfatireligans]|uniref:Foldase protein PrsA 3 n=1 Tax=Pontiella sulfatireligans TaxID=2750658 RepID=A0A6C2UKL8_9BACT|nr:peptidylprolyl isomerase [Pontiella sulfatireligans]VGO20782.1 Foldase protein PrsA 3 [Pontiella sulfatireligans]
MSEEKKDPILVNGEEVGDGLIEQELQMLRERYAREMSHEEMEEKQAKIESDARENAVERVLLMQQARTEIEHVRSEEIEARFIALKTQHGGEEEFQKRFELAPEDEAKIKADIEDGVRLEKYFDQICASAARPGEADSRAYYEEHGDEFLVPETVHAAHIVQHPSPEAPMEKVYADLLNVRERLRAGEDFDALAGEYSHCQDGGHDLGFFARGQMVPSFEEVAFKTEVGGCSDVFQTEFGYHILTVLDHKPATVREYDEVRYDIESMLFEERKNEAIGVVADELRAAADIQNLEIVTD